MAARLMCHSYATRGILCDQKTYNLCSGEFQFDSLGETTVKGKKEPISIFRPVAAIPETEKINKPENAIATSEVIGREEEKQAILDNLNQLSTSSEVDMLFFLADGGLGLSTLVNIAQVEALKQGCNIWYLFYILILSDAIIVSEKEDRWNKTTFLSGSQSSLI